MLSIQHVMSAVLATGDDREWLNGHIAALVFPDAVRAYSGPRQYTHFERSVDGADVSWWKLPTDMKSVNQESVAESLTESHLAKVRPCAIGEETDLRAFFDHNTHLSKAMRDGVELHLRQDRTFDAFIREHIDCSRRYEDVFVFDGSEYDGKGIRGVIADIEQQGIYIAAKRICEEYGVTCDSKWVDSYVRPILERDYAPELAEKTLGFMCIRKDIDRCISVADFSHVGDGPLPVSTFDGLYRDVDRDYEREMARRMDVAERIADRFSHAGSDMDLSL